MKKVSIQSFTSEYKLTNAFFVFKQNINDSDRGREASGTVPRIVAAMGAASVEAVTDIRYASENISSFNYIVVKEPEKIAAALRDAQDVDIVDVTWIKECLIAGRLLPI